MKLFKLFILFTIFNLSYLYSEDRLNYQLYEACESGDIKKIRELIRKGVNVNEKSDFIEDTALLIASRKGSFDIVKLLIENGADVNLNTPIRDAIMNGHYDIVKLLMENKAEYSNNLFKIIYIDSYLNKFVTESLTSLEIAARYEHRDIAKLLINNNADYKNNDWYAVKLIISKNYDDVFKSLLDKGININYQYSNYNNHSLLMYAIDKNSTNIIKQILDKKPNLKITNNSRKTAIMLAMDYSYSKDIMNIFFNSYVFDKYKTLISSYTNNNSVIEEINNMVTNQKLYLGRDTSFESKNGNTKSFEKGTYLISLCTALEYYDVAQQLIDIGYLDIDKNFNNTYPLLYAINGNDLEGVKFLLKNNAYIYNTINNDYEYYEDYKNTTLMYAIEKGNKDIVEALLSKKISLNENDGKELYLAVKDNKLEIAELLIENKSDVNTRYDNKTYLMIAAENNNREMAELLISKKADINTKVDDNKTALHYAFDNNNFEMYDYLKSKGAIETEDLKIKMQELKTLEEEKRIKEQEEIEIQNRLKEQELKKLEAERQRLIYEADRRALIEKNMNSINIAKGFNTFGIITMIGGALTAASPFMLNAVNGQPNNFDFFDFSKTDKTSKLNRTLFFTGIGLFTAGALTSIISSVYKSNLERKIYYSFAPIINQNQNGVLDYGYIFSFNYKL
ncbi:Conserved hypothetical membrane protein [Brachyspira suanatina]|uniref:Conserved hypothetical membrane protein n=1 Tax=Brachyspira suanatina TaxID=381802 RepID=A0A0G4K8X8_9SPIR|nr:ankyrin repeat domain-containing protein [Brachyspira suanatina]CRF34539.1 Conserved hypothetical membrane protein [Brachyspira suanatina]